MAVDSLYQNKQTKPTQEISLYESQEDLLDNLKVDMFEDDEDKSKTLKYLSKEFRDMDDSRPDEHWDLYIQQMNAEVSVGEDGLANVNLPIEEATVRNKLADMDSTKSVVELLPTEQDDVYKRELYREIWGFVWNEANTDKEITKWKMGALIFGASWWFEGLHQEIYTRYEPVYGDDGKVTSKPVTEKRSWLRGKTLDIRDVWVTPASDIDDVKACFIREELTVEQIKGLKEDPNYNVDEIDRLLSTSRKSPRGTAAQSQTYSFQTNEELGDVYDQVIIVMHYYNEEKGIYIVTDENFKYMLREGVNPYPHGQIPLTLLIDHPKYQELYGKGECELLQSTKYERNMIRNQIIDYARSSNVFNLVIGEDAVFEGAEMVNGVAQIWNVSGNAGNTNFMKPPSQDGGLYRVEEMLKDDCTWMTGIDNNSLVGSPSKTAFEARLQEQTKLKGIMVTMKQFDFALTRMARQRLANIQAFLPFTTGKKILGERRDDKKYRTIALQNRRRKPIKGLDGIDLVDKSIGFEKEEGSVEFLELKPSLIKSNLDIVVSTPTTTPILKELDRLDMREVFTSLMEMAQTEEGAKVVSEFEFNQYYRDMMKQKGFDPDKYMKPKPEDTKIKQMRKNIMGGIPQPMDLMGSVPAKNKAEVMKNGISQEAEQMIGRFQQ